MIPLFCPGGLILAVSEDCLCIFLPSEVRNRSCNSYENSCECNCENVTQIDISCSEYTVSFMGEAGCFSEVTDVIGAKVTNVVVLAGVARSMLFCCMLFLSGIAISR